MAKIRMQDIKYHGMFQSNNIKRHYWDNPKQDEEALRVVKRLKKKR